MSFAVLLGLTFSLLYNGNVNTDKGVPDNIVDTAVKIDAQFSHGSGVVFNNGKYTYVWSAAHVVRSVQSIQKVFDGKTGKEKVTITYRDVWVNQLIVENGRKVGERKFLAKIIRYSRKQDLVLLKVYATNRFKNSVTFSKSLPKLGVTIWAVGSPKGTVGYQSVSKGVLSALGRLRVGFDNDDEGGILYDQVALAATRGSSGCAVYLNNEKCECIGLLTEFLYTIDETPGMMCIVPTRRIIEFARRNNCMYAVDNTVAVPPSESVITDDEFVITTAR